MFPSSDMQSAAIHLSTWPPYQSAGRPPIITSNRLHNRDISGEGDSQWAVSWQLAVANGWCCNQIHYTVNHSCPCKATALHIFDHLSTLHFRDLDIETLGTTAPHMHTDLTLTFSQLTLIFIYRPLQQEIERRRFGIIIINTRDLLFS